MEKYDPRTIEPKWRQTWDSQNLSHATEDPDKEKYYCLDMFPYPSGEGLHVGHWRGYVLSDLWTRYQMMKGKSVLHPMGWDAFGLPAENRAIKQGIHPAESNEQAIPNFKRQLNELGALYDWSREINTAEPDYYRWTQWLFLKLYHMGLAYKKEALVNWCPIDKTVLANEQVIMGKCERCGNKVEKKSLEQWFLGITDYAEELLDFSEIDWPGRVKTLQKNWIGKSEGLLFTAPVKDTNLVIQTYSAHYQAFYADSFVVIAPEHPLLPQLVSGVDSEQEVLSFAKELVFKRVEQAYSEEQDSKGIFTGRYLADPVTKKDLPIWVASFALADYGTGIVKCSAHDERDFKFAKKYSIPLKVVLVPEDLELRNKVLNLEVCYTDMENGILLEPAELAGTRAKDASEKIIEYAQKLGFAERKTQYRLRDWLISRQRYWGAPIPIIYCQEHGPVPVPEDELPVILPYEADFQPGGESPLARDPDFVNTSCPKCGGPAKRETDTMDTFVDSSWYYLRYCDPYNKSAAFSDESVSYWMPVDLYVGGIEHAILHLLYARFFTKALADAKLVNFREPFKRLFNIGMIYLAGKKMSKSKGNIVNPDELVKRYGTDTLRGYELFIAPAEQDTQWSTGGVAGVYRFLNKVWENLMKESSTERDVRPITHQLIKTVTEDLEAFNFNTIVSNLMSYINAASKTGLSQQEKMIFTQLLAPISPHIAEELWQRLGNQDSIFKSTWPIYNTERIGSETVTIVVQVNGKTKGTLRLTDNPDEETVRAAVIKEFSNLDGHRAKRIIFIPGRLINFVLD